MSEEEYKECSVVVYPHDIRFLHINGGHISYYVDRHISDYVSKLQKENEELKNDNAVMKAGLIEIRDKQLEQYKSVLDEIREYINNNTKEEYENIELDEHFGMILQILDKVKE